MSKIKYNHRILPVLTDIKNFKLTFCLCTHFIFIQKDLKSAKVYINEEILYIWI